ncbi:MAG: orotate phosphoribosyltransferase-like protein [ANME-2 cluster archaeon]|nr:orotate phosphoribosyltransferase-like protein [ANME-2 cluster archaeon]
MKNIRELIQKALELQQSGLSEGQIADELNVSGDTATWLVAHSAKGEISQAPKDIYVNWTSIGKNSRRLRLVAGVITDMLQESLERSQSTVDVVVGVALSGVPLASMVAEELDVELAVFQSNKQSHKGMLSQNFSSVDGKDCVIVDDVITTGNTISNVISLLRSRNANPTAIAVLIDKNGMDFIEGVPVSSMLRVSRVDKVD